MSLPPETRERIERIAEEASEEMRSHAFPTLVLVKYMRLLVEQEQRERNPPTAALDDGHTFEITGKRHSIGKTPGFPNGIWYGAVDGRECTAPYYSEDAAIKAARHQLEHGGLKAAILTSIECMEGWVATGYQVEKSKARIEQERALLEKIERRYLTP